MKNSTTSSDRFFMSLEKETRYCILECSVFMEEKASDTLGKLLGIDSKNSESLGYGSASLSFDSKIRLIQDLKGINTKTKSQFQTFMAIRNKFAHIAEIDSFISYFELIKSSKDRKKELEKWFPNLNWKSDDKELLYKLAYFSLTLNLLEALFDIDIKHAYETGCSEGRKHANEKFFQNISSELNKTVEGKKILNETFEKIKSNIGSLVSH